MSTPVLVISNPASGDRTGPKFLSDHVLPLLDAHGVPYTVKTTDAPNHAGDLALEYLSSLSSQVGPVTVIVGGGDGTLHEIVNALLKSSESRGKLPAEGLRFVILPLGTANALYYSFFPPSSTQSPEVQEILKSTPEDVKPKLLSLAEFLLRLKPGKGRHHPLTLAQTSFLSAPSASTPPPEPIISAVVTSTSLHAAILDTAESLRNEYPGVERFKQAAQRNIEKWYEAEVRLFPLEGSGSVQLYDPGKDAFEEVEEGEGTTEFDEPFAYFLSTVNVDRLEPAFRIAPLSRSLPASENVPGMDVLLIRPKRDTAFTKDLTAARAAFPGKVMQVMQGAYQDGKHVKFRYDAEGEIVEEGEGKTVVEYYRCGGWEWSPENGDKSAHLVCADGTIIRIPEGGKAVCEVLPSTEAKFSVWA